MKKFYIAGRKITVLESEQERKNAKKLMTSKNKEDTELNCSELIAAIPGGEDNANNC